MSIFIQCPNCKALYKQQELENVKGGIDRVRCGRCRHIFNPAEYQARQPKKIGDPQAAKMWENDVLILPNTDIESIKQSQDSRKTNKLSTKDKVSRSRPRTSKHPKPKIKAKSRASKSNKSARHNKVRDSKEKATRSDKRKSVDCLPKAMIRREPVFEGDKDITPPPGNDADLNSGPTISKQPTMAPLEIDQDVLALVARDKPLVVRILQGVFTSVVVIGLMLGLAWQVYNNYWQQLAQQPLLRPLLVQTCGFLDCAVPIRRNSALIDLADTGIISHPTRPGALRVTLALNNRAPYDQPYPTISLSLTDRTGTVIARKSYRPGDYLSKAELNLRSRVLTPVELDLVSPPIAAVGYEVGLLSN